MNLCSHLVNAKKVISALLVSASLLAAAPAVRAQGIGLQAVFATGGGSSTVTDLEENPDGTLTLHAVEQGTLAHFGAFTGTFTYLATIDPTTGTTYLDGTGEFDFGADKMNLTVHIVETGQDYPKPYFGILTVTGGTGQFANAAGYLAISGMDEESLTDGFTLQGVIARTKVAKP